MLQSLGDSIKHAKWLGYGIVLLIVIPFALWGIGSYFRGGGETFAVKVNGVEIDLRALDREYNEQRNRLQQAFGGRLPPQFADSSLLREQALESLIARELLRQAVLEDGLYVGDEVLAARLLQMKEFHKDGEFDKVRYEGQLRSIGLSTAQFEENTRRALTLEQTRKGVLNTEFRLPSERARLDQLKAQRRNLALIALSRKSAELGIEISDQEITDYYEANKDRFAHPPAVQLDYVELDDKALMDKVEIDAEEIRALYKDQPERFEKPEARVASHILLELDPDADEDRVAERRKELQALKEPLSAGESFEALAKEHSDDSGSADKGGDLGRVTRGIMVKPFEDALFALAEGEVSDPVRTKFGWHLIKLTAIEPGTQKPFEEVRETLELEYRQRRADSLFYDRAEILGNESYENSNSLAPAAETTGLENNTTDWIEQGSEAGIAVHPSVRQAAFSHEATEQRLNSDLIEVGENHVIVLRVKDFRESTSKSLEEVRDEIHKILLNEKAAERLQATADEVVAALEDGDSPNEVAKRFDATFEQMGLVGREESGQDSQVLDTLFQMERPPAGQSSYQSVRMAGGDQRVLILSGVEAGMVQQEDVPADDNQDVRQLGSRFFSAWLDDLRSKAEIVRGSDLL